MRSDCFQDSVYLTERGQNINKRPNIVYVSTDQGTTWVPLHLFVDVSALLQLFKIAINPFYHINLLHWLIGKEFVWRVL